MSVNDRLIKDLADRCTGCGNCRISCPVFGRMNREQFSARGRINLIRGLALKDLEPSYRLKQYVFTCLDCRQCLIYCPADVDYVDLMSLAKRKLKSKSRFFSLRDMVIAGLFSPGEQDLFFSLIRHAGNMMRKIRALRPLKKAVSGLMDKLHIPEFTEIPAGSFFSIRRRHKLKDYRHIRTALFTGCGGKYLYPETSDRFIKILRNTGIETVIPKDQVCCGRPLQYAGLTRQDGFSRKANIKAFNSLVEINFLTVLCPNALPELQDLRSENESPALRFEVRDYREILTEGVNGLLPEHNSSIMFHSCPKCGDPEVSLRFIKKLYGANAVSIHFTADYCGSTELMDRSNKRIRYEITRDFCEKNRIGSYSFIACSSFECVEYLNSYFTDNGLNTRAIHFTDAVRA